MDFYQIGTREIERGPRKGDFEIFPDFTVGRSKDLMVRGRSFYAIWDEEQNLWSTDEYDVQRLVDEELYAYAKQKTGSTETELHVKSLRSFGSNGWSQFRKFMQNISDNSHQLDENLTFSNTEVKKSDYVSRRLAYPLEAGDYSAWDELVGTLYSPEERAKIEWAIGAVVSGDSKKIQKFLVFYGPAGTGKSTVLNIIQKLFEGYTTTFDAKALGSNGGGFSTEVFKNNPLVAIQHDGDLSKIEDNTKLNSIISHEDMPMNEKYKPSYTSRVNAFLFMGTNQPVKISDAKSGIIRRLIDVHPTGVKFPADHYHTLMARIDFELGAIAHRCLEVYREMGKNYYNAYRPLEMMLQTDIFFNYIEACFDIFKEQDGTSLKQAYSLYKEFCSDTGIEKQLPQFKVREELRNYFDEFKDRATVDGVMVRSYYSGFNANKFKAPVKNEKTFTLVMDDTTSIFDLEYADLPAQYATEADTPKQSWSNVKTTLAEIDTSQVHFVKVPEDHIVIDFDLKDETGGKSLERNLEAASVWPATYAEFSKSGAGVHLHYVYSGDTTELDPNYTEGIEVKVFRGGSSLRRRLSRCNNVPISVLNSGLPLKEKKMLPVDNIKSEKGLRDLIARNLRKEIHPGTKPSIDFIQKILEEAYESGMTYDVSDLRPRIIAFANNSSNQPLQSLKIVQKMKWASSESLEDLQDRGSAFVKPKDDRLVLFDVEVYPNLFVVCWKYEGDDNVVRMINPSPQDVESLFRLKLVGFNNRRYDNHILYARYLGYDNEQLYKLSQKIISGVVGSLFGEAYNLSYADIYDFSSKKQSLKKFEIELGIHHMELDLPWDEPVAEEDIPRVVEYCVNDVNATDATLQARRQDLVAREILAALSGLTINDTTQKHTARIIFGNDRNPQASFVYTNLSKEFPGYVYDMGKSTYRDESVGEGGYVYAEPGMYEDVALLDIASMHPTSIEQLNLFGEYTPNFSALKNARLAIKHGDYDSARKMLNGKLEPYLKNEDDAQALSYALKIVINIVYGLTAAKFDNPFRDPRNKDNIVAKRGALFMIDLKHAVQERGFTVAHIKTDSIKIPNATPEIIEFVTTFGQKYGYDFEHEATYDKFCLVNDAVYIARKNEKWEAVGAQFQHPYVFKTLFTGEEITFDDMCETKQVTQGAMYLDFEHDRPIALAEGMHFVGRTGRFVPVTQNSGGGILYRVKEDKSYAVTGTKGYFWLEAEMAKNLDNIEIDMNYFENLVEEAVQTISKFGDYEKFVFWEN
jgi:Predicted ATPase